MFLYDECMFLQKTYLFLYYTIIVFLTEKVITLNDFSIVIYGLRKQVNMSDNVF